MSLDPSTFSKASSLMHFLQGAAFLVLALGQIYLLRGGKKCLRAAGPAAFLLAGIGGFVAILALPGGWSPAVSSQALMARKGFQVLVGLSCLFTAAGLSGFMAMAEGAAGERWYKVSAAFIIFIALLYFLLPWRVNEAARQHALAAHYLTGGVLLPGVLAGLAHAFTGRIVFLRACAFFFIVAAVQLMFYREVPEAYEPYQVTYTSYAAGAPGYTPPPFTDRCLNC